MTCVSWAWDFSGFIKMVPKANVPVRQKVVKHSGSRLQWAP